MSIDNNINNNNINNKDDTTAEYQTNDINNISAIENYKAVIELGSIEIFAKYIDVVSKYITHFRNTTNVRNNVEYYKYILIKGINTICHVFKILLLYTKNIDLVVHHCEKSFFYYIEFIRQIDEESHTLLKLNSTDASYFVFKKTIYEINHEYRKQFNQIDDEEEHKDEYVGTGHVDDNTDRLKTTRMNKMIDIYNRLLTKIVHSSILLDDQQSNIGNINSGEKLVSFKTKINKLSNIFLHYLQGENECEGRFFELLNVAETFVFNYKNYSKCIVPYFDILLKKIKKKVGDKYNKLANSSEILCQISKNIQGALFTINHNHVEEYDTNTTPSKYISSLMK